MPVSKYKLKVDKYSIFDRKLSLCNIKIVNTTNRSSRPSFAALVPAAHLDVMNTELAQLNVNMNRNELEKKLSPITSTLLKEKGYISLIDVFVGLGYLSEKDLEAWRMRQIPYLEKGIKTNLGKINFIGKTVRNNCLKGKLKESFASYKSWGKGAKVTLRFCKSGNQNIEKAYATHYWIHKALQLRSTLN